MQDQDAQAGSGGYCCVCCLQAITGGSGGSAIFRSGLMTSRVSDITGTFRCACTAASMLKLQHNNMAFLFCACASQPTHSTSRCTSIILSARLCCVGLSNCYLTKTAAGSCSKVVQEPGAVVGLAARQHANDNAACRRYATHRHGDQGTTGQHTYHSFGSLSLSKQQHDSTWSTRLVVVFCSGSLLTSNE